MDQGPQQSPARGDIRKSLDEVMDAAEALLRSTASETNAEYHKVRDALDAKVRAAKAKVGERGRDFVADAKDIGERGDAFVRENPWTSVCIGTGVGLLLGALLRPR